LEPTQWLTLHATNAGPWFQSLVRDLDLTCHAETTKQNKTKTGY